MEIKINTNKLSEYARTHLRAIAPIGMWFLSYVLAKHVECDCTFLNVFFGATATFTFVMSIILTISFLGRVFDWDLS